jgi:hypothetical protein
MSVASQRVTPAVRLYSIAGRKLSVSTAGEWPARMAESFLGGFHFQPHDDPDGQGVVCPLHIHEGPAPGVPAGFMRYELDLGPLYTDGEEYHINVNDSRVAVGPPASPRVDVWLGDGPLSKNPFAFVNTMTCALQFALRRGGLMQLHSAGAVEPETGAGLLVVGDSNSGKSSLTIRLARAGWPYLSDDMLLLHEEPDAVAAHALRRVFSVSAGSIAGCDLPRLEEALGSSLNSDPTKRSLDPTVVFPGGFAASCVPSVVVFPRIAGAKETKVERLSRSEALLRLVKASPWACFDADGRGYMNLVGRLVRQTRAYAIEAGRDLLDDLSLAPRLFGRLVEG